MIAVTCIPTNIEILQLQNNSRNEHIWILVLGVIYKTVMDVT